MKIGVTGGNGFVGRALVEYFENAGYAVRPIVRSLRDGVNAVAVGNISGVTDWSEALSGLEVIVHTAARAQSSSGDVIEERAINEVNVVGTLNLARQAVANRVRRFIFISSVKVNGEITANGRSFRADDAPNPDDLYAKSKYRAERGLLEIAGETGLELVIIRPPLVYGRGVAGNMGSLLAIIRRGLPLPLASVKFNQRSMVSLVNLCSLVDICLEHPRAAGRVFMVSDGEDLSTAELLELLGSAAGVSARLFPFPPKILRFVARAAGKRKAVDKLLGNLQVDVSVTREVLGWRPVSGVAESMKSMGGNPGL